MSTSVGDVRPTKIDYSQIQRLQTKTAHNISLQECQKICAEIMAKGIPNTSFAVHASEADAQAARGRIA